MVPPSRAGDRAIIPARTRRTIADTVAAPIEEAVNGVENMIYMKSTRAATAQLPLTVTFKPGTDPDLAQVQVQNRVARRSPRLARGRAATRRHHAEAVARTSRSSSTRSRRTGRYDALYCATSPPCTCATSSRDSRASATRCCSARRLRDAHLARPGQGSRARHDRPATSCARSASRTSQVAAGSVGSRRRRDGVELQLSVNAQGRLTSPGGVRRIIVLKPGGRRARPAEGRRRVELGAADYAIQSLLDNQDGGRRSCIFQAPGSNAIALSRRHPRQDGGARAAASRRASRWTWSYDPTVFVQRLDRAVIDDADRGDPARRHRRAPVPADLARVDHPADRRAGVDHRHVRGDARCSASRSTR